MGRYFGVVNETKQHKVSSYWKGCPPSISEIKKMAIMFGWNLKTDRIISSSYCDYLVYDNRDKCWNDIRQHQPEYSEGEEGMGPELEPDIESDGMPELEPDTAPKYICLGYDDNHDTTVPQDIESNIRQYSSTFDSVFFCA